MWRIKLALLWTVLLAVEGLASLVRARLSAQGWMVLTQTAFYGPVNLLRFALTGRYPSRYGGFFQFTGVSAEDNATIACMQGDCPPLETLVAYACGQLDIPGQDELIRRDLIYAHVSECASCERACRTIRGEAKESIPAPIIVFK